MSADLKQKAMAAVREVRAYFAPVNRATSTPSLFDPTSMVSGAVPPSPWVDCGVVHGFTRSGGAAVESLHAGLRAGIAAQVRGPVSARVAFRFAEWNKLAMVLSGGSQQVNVLEPETSSPAAPCGGAPKAAVAVVAAQSDAQNIAFGAATDMTFAAGDMLAIDIDYSGQTGYVGSGAAGAYVKSAADVQADPDYVRRVTLNVGRVESVSANALKLTKPLVGGAPRAGAQAQKVVGFLDREGGSFFQEWSGLFVADCESGGRVCFYYPRLRPAVGASETSTELFGGIRSLELVAELIALPNADTLDGEQVVCYRSYLPWRAAAI